jgi:hypothetical protein
VSCTALAGAPVAGLASGGLTSLPASHRCSSIPPTAVQSSFSTISCECLYSRYSRATVSHVLFIKPADPLPQRPRTFFFLCLFCLNSDSRPNPSHFSTPSKHRTHSNARSSTRFTRLLHFSRRTRAGGRQYQAKHFFRSPFRFQLSPPPTLPIAPFVATFADSLPLAETNMTLSPFAATLTRHFGPNSFVCHLQKTPTGGGHPFQT